MILENKEDVEKLISFLDRKIIDLRNSKLLYNDKKFKSAMLLAKEFYDNIVMPWYDKFLRTQNEPSTKEEQEMNDTILDVISGINKLLNQK